MKPLMLFLTLTFLNIQLGFLPKGDLLIIMGLAMLLDFITGVVKAVYINQPRTSKGFRGTIIKFIQYGSAILIGMGISYMGSEINQYNPTWKNITLYMSWFNNGLLILIIMIEVTSILENCYAINKKSAFSRYVIKPALKIMTVQIKGNPLTKVTFETEDEGAVVEIEEKVITSKNIKP